MPETKKRRKNATKKPAATLTNDELRELSQFNKARIMFPNFSTEKILSIVRDGISEDQEAIFQKKMQRVTKKYVLSLNELGLMGHSFEIDAQKTSGGDISYKVIGSTSPTKDTLPAKSVKTAWNNKK